MIDVDHFKAINDTHGHGVGDEVLRHVARVLSTGVRVSDDVGRWGGEEFLVRLPELDRRGAVVAAGRLRELIERALLRAEEWTLHVSVSIGVALVDSEHIDRLGLDDLTRVADDALYRAKIQGRNRVVCAD